MPFVESVFRKLIAAVVYDGLKCEGRIILGPYYKTFQKAQKKAQQQLKKEFSEGELLAVFTTFNNMEWKLSFGIEARQEIERNLIKGVEAINGQVFVDELVAELHENNRQYGIELVKKVIVRFVEIVSEELRANHEILNYLQDIKLERIIGKIDELSQVSMRAERSLTEISEVVRRVEEKLDKMEKREAGLKWHVDGIPHSEDLNLIMLLLEGLGYVDNYKYDKAIKTFRTGLSLQGVKPSECSALLINIGNAQYKQSKWDQAMGSWKEALDTAEKTNDEQGQAAALGNLGLVYQDKGEWDKAIEFYNKSLKIKEKIGDEHGMAQTFNNLGSVYQAKGEWDKAIEFYNKSLKIDERIGDEQGMAQTYNNLGLVYQDKDEWDKAIEFYNKSLKIKEKIGDEYGMAQTYCNAGNVYGDKGEWDKAIEFYNKALKGLEKIGDEHGMAKTEANIGILYKMQGRKDEAKRLLEESLKTFDKIGDRPNAEIVRGHLEDL